MSRIVKPNIMNNSAIKLQGVAYYSDCYKLWDLNLCEDSFQSSFYNDIILSLIRKTHRYYSNTGSMAVIDFSLYDFKFEDYYNKLSKNVVRDIKLSNKNLFYLKEFNFNDFVYDFSKINFSQNKRRVANKWYLQDPLVYKGAHSGYTHEWEDANHYSKWYGLFKYFKHYKQGDLITNEKLFAYCKLAVDGEMATVTLFWGDASQYSNGIMFHLLIDTIKVAMNIPTIKCFVYYGMAQYTKWKTRMLFTDTKIDVKI